MSFSGQSEIGNVLVQTTSHRGFAPEEIAERAIHKVIRVESKEDLKQVLVRYLREAQESERKTIREQLVKADYTDAATFLGDM